MRPEASVSVNDNPEERTQSVENFHNSNTLNNEAKCTSPHDVEAGPTDAETQQAAASSEGKVIDPNIVDWDGPNDPQNPMNWPQSTRTGHVILVSAITLIVCAHLPLNPSPPLTKSQTSNLASTMYAPGAPLLMQDFYATNPTIGSLTVTIYLLGFALGPLLVAPLSELYGRLILYHACNSLFTIFTIACALSSNVGMFLAFRFLAGCTGAAPLTIGGGTVADVIPQAKRGSAMAMFAVGPLLGPVVGPVAGGFIAQYVGWRWTFWIMAIMASFFPTFPPGVPELMPFWWDV